MLTDAQKIAVREFLDVPFSGVTEAGRLLGWRFTEHYEDLEFKLNNMKPNESARLTGAATGSFALYGKPSAGDVYTFNVGGTEVVFTVSPADANAANPQYATVLDAANVISAAVIGTGIYAVGLNPADTGLTQANVPPYFAGIIFSGPSSAPFTLSGTSTGTSNLVLVEPCSPCPVSGTFGSPQNPTTLYGYIAICQYLKNNVAVRSDRNLSLTQAKKVIFREDEVAQRIGLYDWYRREMARAIGGEKYVRAFFGGRGGRGATA